MTPAAPLRRDRPTRTGTRTELPHWVVTPSLGHVRFAPESGLKSDIVTCPLSANRVRVQCGKQHLIRSPRRRTATQRVHHGADFISLYGGEIGMHRHSGRRML
jgi:hypothetical protein